MGLFKKIKKLAIPAAATAAGYALGGGSGALQGAGLGLKFLGARRAADSAEEQAQLNYEMQKEFAQHGIQWKVEDAKRAGLHPVYALGGAGAAFAPNPIIVDPLAEAMMSMGQSAFNRSYKDSTNAGRVPDADLGAIQTTPYAGGPEQVPLDKWTMQPNSITSMSSSMSGVAAGPAAPGMYLYNIGGTPILLPGKDVSEAAEAISESPLVMGGIVLKANYKALGEKATDDFVREVIPLGEEALMVRNALRDARDKLVETAEWWRDNRPFTYERKMEIIFGDRSNKGPTVKGKIRRGADYPTPWGIYHGNE